MNSSCSSFKKSCKSPTAAEYEAHKPILRRTVVVSKTLPQKSTGDSKSFSTGRIKNHNKISTTRKSTKSDGVFSNLQDISSNIQELSDKCGDTRSGVGTTRSGSENTENKSKNIHPKKNAKNVISSKGYMNSSNFLSKSTARSSNSGGTKVGTFLKIPGKNSSVQQYFKNDRFLVAQDSLDVIESKNSIKKYPSSLEVIKEATKTTDNSSKTTMYEVNEESPSDEHYDNKDTDNIEHLRKLKEFREKNYFECHSSKSRISSKGSSTSLNNHKCVYRFYLNDRLFPVPLSSDHHGNIRCVECHLPRGDVTKDGDEAINATIQVKVNLQDDLTQDLTLLLPVKDNLIIKSKRKPINDKEDTIYFGIVKLNSYGNSKFNPTIPENSLALKYQKGYREFSENKPYSYKKFGSNDVIKI